MNNAGFAYVGDVHEHPAEQVGMVRVNIEALVELTGAFLPAIVERGRGADHQRRVDGSVSADSRTGHLCRDEGVRAELLGSARRRGPRTRA